MESPRKITITKCFNCCTDFTSQGSSSLPQNIISPEGLSRGLFDVLLHSLQDVEPAEIMCNTCLAIQTKLHKSQQKFNDRTKSNSIVGRITGERNTRFKMAYYYEKLKLRNNNDMQLNVKVEEKEESIFPFDINYLSDSEENLPIVEQIEYLEQHLELRMPKFKDRIKIESNFNFMNKCTHCGRHFDSILLLENHYNAAHRTPEKLWSCKICDISYSFLWFYKNHLRVFHGEREIQIQFSCILCNEICANQEELDKHKLKAHRLTSHPFKCNYCETAFETMDEIGLLRDHLIESHSDSLEAMAALFNKKYIIEKKEQLISRTGECECSHCQERLERRFLRHHILFAHHGQTECSVCLLKFDNWREFADHVMKIQHTQNQCYICKKVMAGLSSLLRHFEQVHVTSKKYVFACEVCGNPFTEFFKLQSHYKWHVRIAGPREHNCSQCNKSFTLKHHLQIHMRRVHPFESEKNNSAKKEIAKELKPNVTTEGYKCKDCGANFKIFKSLSQHVRWVHVKKTFGPGRYSHLAHKHTDEGKYMLKTTDGERQYACNLCQKTYKRSDHCIRHLFKVHSVHLRPHKSILNKPCHICGKVLSANAFKHHVRLHETKPHGAGWMTCACHLCKWEFKGIHVLRSHYQDQHPNTKEAKYAGHNTILHNQEKSSETLNICSDRNKCIVCDMLFLTVIEKDEHDDKFHQRKIQCLLCQMEFSRSNDCRKHEKTFHKDFPCRFCDKIMPSVESYYSHFEKHLKIPYVCEVCGQYVPETLRSHYNSHYRDKTKRKHKRSSVKQTTVCKTCKESFSTKKSYVDHMENFHKLIASVKCKECDLLFFTVPCLTNHMRFTHKKVGHQLMSDKETNESASNDSDLDSVSIGHKSNAKKSTKDDNYKCAKCNLGFRNVESYNYHIRAYHLKTRLYKNSGKINKSKIKNRISKTVSSPNNRPRSQRNVNQSYKAKYSDSTSESEESSGSWNPDADSE